MSFQQKKTALVLGAGGFIGSHCLKYFIEKKKKKVLKNVNQFFTSFTRQKFNCIAVRLYLAHPEPRWVVVEIKNPTISDEVFVVKHTLLLITYHNKKFRRTNR